MSLILILCNGPRLGVILSTQCSILSFLGIFEKWLGEVSGASDVSGGCLLCPVWSSMDVSKGCTGAGVKGSKFLAKMTHFFHGGGGGGLGDRPTAHSISDPSALPLSIRLGV